MKKTIAKKSKRGFTLKEDADIKKLLTIMRAVSREKQLSIVQTLRIYYGLYVPMFQLPTRVFTVDDYENLKKEGIITIKPQ